MRRSFTLLAGALLLTGCGGNEVVGSREIPAVTDCESTQPETVTAAAAATDAVSVTDAEKTSTGLAAEPVTDPPADGPTEAVTETPTEWHGEENVALPYYAPPAYAFVLDVPYYSQAQMPTGCELVSTSMLMAYYDLDVSAYDLIDGGYIGVSVLEEDEEQDDKLRGGDPNEVFIGDPFDKTGYGCYSGAIVSGLNSYLEDEPVSAYDLSGMSLPDICAEYIDYETPVLIWATRGMMTPVIKPQNSWFIGDTSQVFTWITNEHCLVLVGYDDDYYYFNDPLVGDAVPYGRALTEQRYSELGSQAVCIM